MKKKQKGQHEIELALLDMLKQAWSDYYSSQIALLNDDRPVRPKRNKRVSEVKYERPRGQ